MKRKVFWFHWHNKREKSDRLNYEAKSHWSWLLFSFIGTLAVGGIVYWIVWLSNNR